MLKINFKSILSWVDSYILDYSTSLLLFCSITFFALVLVSPTITIYWLFLFTFYFLYKGLYKNIFIIWGFYSFSWYFIFTALFIGFEDKILTGDEYIGPLFFYAFVKYSKLIF